MSLESSESSETNPYGPMLVIRIPATICTQHKKKDSKGKSTNCTKYRHQIKKVPIELDVDDMGYLRKEYSVSLREGLMLVPRHLLNNDDPLTRWYIIHS